MIKIKYLLVCFMVIVGFNSFGQDDETLGKHIDDLTYAWDLEADNLDDYDGMSKFCSDKPYRLEVLQMLKDIHHYDSVLYDRLIKASRFSHDREVKKTIQDIEKFEREYDMKTFIGFLFDECQGIIELEKNKKDLQDEVGMESYDGKRYVLETELAKYIHHITKRVDLIREHAHHLHVK